VELEKRTRATFTIAAKITLVRCSLIRIYFIIYHSSFVVTVYVQFSFLNHLLQTFLFVLAGISRFSGGCIYHFPLFKVSDTILSDSFERSFRRYLTRKIGFEAVMRIRCSRYGKGM
jgi:hypothetical protein